MPNPPARPGRGERVAGDALVAAPEDDDQVQDDQDGHLGHQEDAKNLGAEIDVAVAQQRDDQRAPRPVSTHHGIGGPVESISMRLARITPS